MNETESIHVVIRGRVQGVFYRRWVQARARRHGLAGWVRNRDDGAVEGVFSGPIDRVDAMVTECREGPPAARVDAVVVTAVAPVLDQGFAIID